MTALRVVYVVGKGRSGSTLLDDMLGSLDGVTSLGELRRLWDRVDEPTYTCTCGQPLRTCLVWGQALASAVGSADGDVAAVAADQAAVHSWSHLPLLLAGRRSRRARAFADVLGRLYARVADETESHTLVDSSKWPAHVGMLGMVPGVEPWVLHLVRDPRAVAYSYTKHKSGTGQIQMPRFGAMHSSLSWGIRNVTAELGCRAVPDGHARLVRYEDLVHAPRDAVRDLGTWLGVPDPTAAFRDEATLHLGTAHLVGGNPRRFERGDVTIRPDEAWRRAAEPRDVRTVEILTRPLRSRYGYHDLAQ